MKSYKVTTTEGFENELDSIVEYIALDSETRAENFEREVYAKIHTLDFNPLRCRASKSINDKNIRDLIFKGYVIIFAIEADSVIVLGIYKANTWRKPK